MKAPAATRLGRVAGIEIGLNWSVLALLALLMWTLATGIFPETNPGLGDNAYFAMAVVASLGFFASILLHELGHALQARRDGMEIDGITLWIFGGVARFAGMFPSRGRRVPHRRGRAPGRRWRSAGGFVGVALIPGMPGPRWTRVCSLARVHQPRPAGLQPDPGPAPGRRADAARRAVGRARATCAAPPRIAATTGRVLAMGLIGLGVLIALTAERVSGIWLAFIGWFVLQAAGAEAPLRARWRRAGTLRVRDMMTTDLVTVSPTRPWRRSPSGSAATRGSRRSR